MLQLSKPFRSTGRGPRRTSTAFFGLAAALLVLCSCSSDTDASPEEYGTGGTGYSGTGGYPAGSGGTDISTGGQAVTGQGYGGQSAAGQGAAGQGAAGQGAAGQGAAGQGAAGQGVAGQGVAGSAGIIADDDCGNGNIDPGEECDGANLGNQTCETMDMGTGELACTPDCSFDMTGCTAEADAGYPDGGDIVPPDGDAGTEPPDPTDLTAFQDPGSGPWQPVAPGDMAEECGLDSDLMQTAASIIRTPMAVSRYGKLCFETDPNDRPTEMYSATKTLGALVTGIASYETRNIQRNGAQTGQLLDSDRADHWLGSVSYNRDAHLAHVMAMVGHNTNLSYGAKSYSYDTIGIVQINTLSTVVSTAISQEAARLGTTTAGFAREFLFDKIGMTDSAWGGTVYATSWTSTMRDMLRVGVLMIHRGVWSGERILDEGWVYKMTHPAFEDANTGYGYLTWLETKEGGAGVGGAFTSNPADPCAPPALWQTYPHGLSEAPNCTYRSFPCEQQYDVGVWSAQGMGGQFIVGHAGLDLVIVGKDFSGGGGPSGLWEAIRPALVALDPNFAGDEAAFCDAYAAGDYAPDLIGTVQQPSD